MYYTFVDLYLREYKQRHNILDYIKTSPYLFSINITTGDSSLELEMKLRDLNHLQELMTDINDKFPNTLRNYKYFIVPRKYLFRYIPEL